MLRRYGHDLHVSGEAEEADSLHSIRHFYSKLVDTVNLLTLLERPRWVFSSRVGSKLALEVTEEGGRERECEHISAGRTEQMCTRAQPRNRALGPLWRLA